MKEHLIILALASALASGTLPAADVEGEQLLFVMPPKWVEVYSGREENLSTTEYIPQSDDPERWNEMLTIQVVLGMANADPETVLANVAVSVAKECYEFDAKPIQLAGTGDTPTLGLMLLCGTHSESGRGEFSLLRGIAGKENFYLLRKSWRTDTYVTSADPPVPLNDRKFWLGYLAYLRVCDPAAGDCPDAEVSAE